MKRVISKYAKKYEKELNEDVKDIEKYVCYIMKELTVFDKWQVSTEIPDLPSVLKHE